MMDLYVDLKLILKLTWAVKDEIQLVLPLK